MFLEMQKVTLFKRVPHVVLPTSPLINSCSSHLYVLHSSAARILFIISLFTYQEDLGIEQKVRSDDRGKGDGVDGDSKRKNLATQWLKIWN